MVKGVAASFFKLHSSNFVESWLFIRSWTGKNLVVISQSTFQKLFLGQLGVEFNKEKHQKCNYSKVLWDITTKFLPVQDLIRSQLSTKFEECSLKNDSATPLTISNFSRAWQAYFLSYTTKTLVKNISYKDLQIILGQRFWISSCLKVSKNVKSLPLHF